jgi:hypothetical protein
MIIYDGFAWKFMHNGRALCPPQFNKNFNGTDWHHESPDVTLTLDTTHVANILYDSTSGSGIPAYYTAAPTPPYTFTCAFLSQNIINGYNKVGIGWRSNGGAYVTLVTGSDNGTNWLLRYDAFTNVTTYSGNYLSVDVPPLLAHGPLIWMQLTDDGTTNRHVKISSNGINWTDMYGGARTNFLSPDNISVLLSTSASVNTGMTLVHMSLS